MNIGRTLFWFKDGNEQLIDLNDTFFPLGTLLNRLLNEVYDGKKMKFINIFISTDETYEMFPVLPKGKAYYYGGHLTYYGEFEMNEFRLLSKHEQSNFLWSRAYEYLLQSAGEIKNEKLLMAVKHAYAKGLEAQLNPDFQLLKSARLINDRMVSASVWIHYRDDRMYSCLEISINNELVFEKELDSAKIGVEFFFCIYRRIEIYKDAIVLTGSKEAGYLPLRISLQDISA